MSYVRGRRTLVESSPIRVSRRLLLGGALGVALSFVAAQSVVGADHDQSDAPRQWIGTWGSSPMVTDGGIFAGLPPASFNNQSVRMIARISQGGSSVRVRLSNEYGSQQVTVGAAHIAISAGGSAIKPGSDRILTFNGQQSVVLRSLSPMLSDPVDLEVSDLESLAISIYFPQDTGPATGHDPFGDGQSTTYISNGNTTATSVLIAPTTKLSRFFLSGVEVTASQDARVVVALGDSITEGFTSTTDANRRWPDILANRLVASSGDVNDVAVVNHGIGGNRLLHTGIGDAAMARFDRDVLATPGVQFVTVLLGTNDIQFGETFLPNEVITANDMIAGFLQLIDRAHSRDLSIYGATITPFAGSGRFTANGEVVRQAINEWIRTSGQFNAVIDFDKAVRDPTNPSNFNPAYDSGDHVHPNDAGYAAMANSIDLRLFKKTHPNK
jgi:lysophospholipase L1-like esterase